MEKPKAQCFPRNGEEWVVFVNMFGAPASFFLPTEEEAMVYANGWAKAIHAKEGKKDCNIVLMKVVKHVYWDGVEEE